MANKKSYNAVVLNDDDGFRETAFEKDVSIDIENLQGEIVQHGGRYWHYGKLHAASIRAVAELANTIKVKERALKALAAKLNEDIRRHSYDQGVKTTEKFIESLVLQDPLYIEAVEALEELQSKMIDAQYTDSILGLAEKIFASRTDLLKTLGHMYRAEHSSDGMSVHTAREMSTQSTARLKQGMREVIKTKTSKRS